MSSGNKLHLSASIPLCQVILDIVDLRDKEEVRVTALSDFFSLFCNLFTLSPSSPSASSSSSLKIQFWDLTKKKKTLWGSLGNFIFFVFFHPWWKEEAFCAPVHGDIRAGRGREERERESVWEDGGRRRRILRWFHPSCELWPTKDAGTPWHRCLKIGSSGVWWQRMTLIMQGKKKRRRRRKKRRKAPLCSFHPPERQTRIGWWRWISDLCVGRLRPGVMMGGLSSHTSQSESSSCCFKSINWLSS